MTHLSEDRHARPAAEKTGVAFAAIAGSEDEPASLETMRAMPAKEVLATFGKTPNRRSGPNVDGWVFPDEVHAIFEQGKQSRVPVLVGSNADEATTFVGAGAPATVEEFRRRAMTRFGDLAEEFLEAYPVSDDADVREAFVASMGDDWFTWQMRMWARLTATGDAKAYLYHFTRVPPIPESDAYGAYHGAEIVYVFGNFHLASFTQQAEDERLAETMSSYWINFATTGDPNGEGLPEWPAYEIETEPYLELGATIWQRTHLRERECDFFEKHYAAERAKP